MFDESLSLVIDSDIRAAKTARDALESLSDDEVRIITSLKEATATIESKRVLFMVIDLSVGIDECLDFIKILRKNSENPNYKTPIIILSEKKENLSKVRDAGANALLLKPFSINGLKELIVKIISNPLNFIMSRNYVGPDRRTRREKLKGLDQRNLRPEK